ncbi:hypothetical protein K0M31_007142 [Melipona bicolor]|uniref:Uncharacterized protein n=1 Tax=Melipona bicolor TaxID=60889 RepID=A0AA40FRR5_9HYME|nr:hypothetical protein K0M31_007142 [Melipona bicolor]
MLLLYAESNTKSGVRSLAFIDLVELLVEEYPAQGVNNNLVNHMNSKEEETHSQDCYV